MNEIGAEELGTPTASRATRNRAGDALPYQLGDYVGRRGLEKRWEAELRGVDGQAARGGGRPRATPSGTRDLIPESQRFEPSWPGLNAWSLSLDWRLQEFAEKTFPGTAGVGAGDGREDRASSSRWWTGRPSTQQAVRPHHPRRAGGRSAPGPAPARAVPRHPAALPPRLDLQGGDRHRRAGGGGAASRAARSTAPATTARWTTLALRQGLAATATVDLEHALGASCDVFFYTLGDRLGTDTIAKWGEPPRSRKADRLRPPRRDPRASCRTRTGTTSTSPAATSTA